MDNTYDSLYYSKGSLIAGLDESGVSDIAGPLVAACVVLPKIAPDSDDLRVFNVNDSKKIPEKYRKTHAEVIYSTAVAIGIGEVQPNEIDYLGKRKATVLAMVRAIMHCRTTTTHSPLTPDFLLVDGEISLPLQIQQICIKDGDTKSLSIASASVIAKVWRDNIMLKFHQNFPYYSWDKNKGYPCEAQFRGLDTRGIQLGIHRTKFWPFVSNDKKEEEKKWHYRRGLWRQKTFGALLEDAGGSLWITREQLSKNSTSSKKDAPKTASTSSESTPD